MTSQSKDLSELYDLQEYYYKYALLGVSGVSEVATVGGVTSELYKKEGSKLLADLQLPTGYYFEWAGESEYLESAMKRLSFILLVVSSAVLTLIVIPAVYFMVIKKER